MFKNYLKTALRNLARHKGYSFINIFGLTVGLATGIFIFLWVADEVGYDRFHEHGDRAFRVLRNVSFTDGRVMTRLSSPEPLAEALQTEVPEIEHTLRLSMPQNLLVRSGEQAFYEKGFYGDSTIFRIFTFPVTRGDAANPLPDIKSIAISERLAKKHFGKTDPLGQTLMVDQRFDLKVSAVFADVPRNSELQFDYIIPFEVWRKENTWLQLWDNAGMQILASLKPGADLASVNEKAGSIIKKHCDECTSTAFLFPYTKLRLYSEFENGRNTGGRIDYVISFSLVAIVILIIACINFMNLSTARAVTRSREVGVRKVVGARRTGLITQFIGESLMLAFIALVFAIVLVQLLLPWFNETADKSITLDLTDPRVIAGAAVITLLCGLMAGSYPAFVLSSFKPASVLKGNTQSIFSGSGLRKVLVVVQFTASVILIIGSMVVYNQSAFIRNTDLGFDKENIVMLDQFKGVARDQEAFKRELRAHPSITNAGLGDHNPFNIQHQTNYVGWPGKPQDAEISFKIINCDHDLIHTLGMTVLEGRNFTGRHDTTHYLINEKAMEVMGLTRSNVIDAGITLWGKGGRIVGLVEDFNNVDLHKEIAPLILAYNPGETWRIFVKVEGDLHQAIGYMRKTQLKYDPEYPFQYALLEEAFNKEYRSEEVVSTLSLSFTVVAIFIACLGLLGLASFTAERRTKELGIRKVMGASAASLAMMLCSDFTRLVIAALVIGCPVAWYLATEYLSGYAFHYELSGWLLVITAAAVLLIALVTVAYQSLKASLTNPVKLLRSE